MFDYAAPKDFPPMRGASRRGVGQHPHRGIETITLVFQGEIEHRDSNGNNILLLPGDCQWMTAARGIVHEEFQSQEFTRQGGILELGQIWINLPQAYKLSDPKYQILRSRDIPCVPIKIRGEKEIDIAVKYGYARVIAGRFRGHDGPAKTFTPIHMWEAIMLSVDKEYEFDIVKGYTTLVFVRKGGVVFVMDEGHKHTTLEMADVALMNREGTSIVLKPTEVETSILILSGEPIDEPIAARGPFVMNNQQELIDAMQDYHRGQNGFSHF